MNIEHIIEKLKTLPSEKQQEALNFVKFLQTKTLQKEVKSQEGEVVSALTLAQKWVGCVEGGSADLSANKKYMESPALGEKENGSQRR
jgi:hypothetical protein